MESWLEIAAKAIVYAAALLLVGAVGLRWVLLPQVKHGLSPAQQQAVASDASRVLLAAASVLVAGLVLRLLAHTVAAFGLQDGWTWDNIRLIAVESRWGGGWQRQIAVAAVVLAAAVVWRAFARSGLVAALAAVGFCFALPLLGHAGGEASRVAIHGFHVLAAGLWVGTLSCMMLASSEGSRAVRPILLHAFGPLAMASVGFLFATGLLTAWTYLGTVSNMWSTEYGRLLTLKLAGVAAVLSLGGANWWRMHRHGSLPVSRFAKLEVIVAGLVVMLTAWLSETGHP